MPACVSPNSSALLGVTLLADRQEVMAALRTVILLARNFKSSLYLDLPEKGAIPIDLSDGASAALLLPDFLNEIDAKLRELSSFHGGGFAVQLDFTAASFLAGGNIAMRIRSAEADFERKP